MTNTKIIDANYCPNCGKPVQKAEKTSDKKLMRKAAADRGRCAVFTGVVKLGGKDTIDFSEIGRVMTPSTAEIYWHGENQ